MRNVYIEVKIVYISIVCMHVCVHKPTYTDIQKYIVYLQLGKIFDFVFLNLLFIVVFK